MSLQVVLSGLVMSDRLSLFKYSSAVLIVSYDSFHYYVLRLCITSYIVLLGFVMCDYGLLLVGILY